MINFKDKMVSIHHKSIEVQVDGKFVPVSEDMLKTQSRVRTLPLVEELLLVEKEKPSKAQQSESGAREA